ICRATPTRTRSRPRMRSKLHALMWGISLGALARAVGLGAASAAAVEASPLALVLPFAAFAVVPLALSLLVELPLWSAVPAGVVGGVFIGASFWVSGSGGPLVGLAVTVPLIAAAFAGLLAGRRLSRRKAHTQPR